MSAPKKAFVGELTIKVQFAALSKGAIQEQADYWEKLVMHPPGVLPLGHNGYSTSLEIGEIGEDAK